MGKRGPKAESNEMKRRLGNPGKRPLKPEKNNGDAILKRLAPPCFMRGDKVAAAEWRRLSKELIARRILTKSNLKALEGYCVSYSVFRRAQEELEKEGLTYETEKGYVGQHPAISIMKGAQAEMRAWWKILDDTKPAAPVKPKGKFGDLRAVK